MGDLRLISYNIAGLPVKSVFEGRSAKLDAAEIGRQVRAAGYDLLAVQEDFCSYRQLRREIQAPYCSFSKGNVPAGDGVDIFSRYPLYNVVRVPWARSYGGITYGAGCEYTPKGFMHAVMALAPGAYVDVYNLHAVAGAYSEWEESAWNEPTIAGEYRRAGFEQLRDYIQAHSAGRALILLGDFNTVLWKVPDGLYDTLIEPLGLKDTWADLFNGGRMAYDGGDWEGGATRDAGSAEFIDKILYRSGGAVEFTVAEAAHVPWKTPQGRDLSDHDSWAATLRYTITGAREADARLRLQKPEPLPAGEKLWGYAAGIRRDAVLLKKEMPRILGRE